MIFNNYANYYNLFYQNKDYESEVEYILDLVKRYKPDTKTILDVGCGTGKHVFSFSESGYQVEGVDVSVNMLNAAKESYPHLHFYLGDARNFVLNKKYDVITSLFHVASYQTSNNDMFQYLKSIGSHLEPDGLFVFDFWYGPAVLEDKPGMRVKRLEDDKVKITRIAEPALHFNENTVDVNYEVLIQEKASGQFEIIKEKHSVRYFFLPEIHFLLESGGFNVLGSFEWLTVKEPTQKNWYVCVVGKKSK